VSDIGNTLRETRVRKGLTIKDVEAATKIRAKYLEALEEDDFEVLPGPTYAKAFLRTYATYLKLDADDLVDSYSRSHSPRRDETGGARGETVRHSQSRSMAERQKRKTRRTQRGLALLGVLAVIAVVLLVWLGSDWGRQSVATIDPESLTSLGSNTSVTQSGATTSSVPPGGSTTTVSVPVTSGENIEMVVNVTQDSCWLVVHEDSEAGAELYAGTLSAGGQMTFDSSKRYWMRVGNPGVLAVTVNGVSVKLDETAGSFVVTEAGVETSQ